MSNNVNSGRSANKRAVIDISDDKANREQPPVKKEAEPVPSQEVLELQQKVAKLEKDKRSLIRIAGESQARVEFLENIIDKKPAVDGEQKKQVDELQRRIDELSNDRDELVDEMSEADGREKGQQKKIDELTKERDDLVRKLAEISYGKKDKLAKEQQKKINKLTNERDDLVSKLGEAEEREKKQQKTINKMKHQLDQYEDVQKQIQQQLLRFPGVQQSPIKAPPKRSVTSMTLRKYFHSDDFLQ